MKARRSKCQVSINGKSLSDLLEKELSSVSYSDAEEDEADDLQIEIADPSGAWMREKLPKLVSDSAEDRLEIRAVFCRENWDSRNEIQTLDTGTFSADSIDSANGRVKIKALSIPSDSGISKTENTQAWESYSLSRIATEIARRGGLTCLFESDSDPFYARVEQVQQADISFLSDLCRTAGISLKVTAHTIVLFDQLKYESKPAVSEIRYGHGYTTYSLKTAKDNTYSSCQVSYTNPVTRRTYSGTFTDPDGKKDGQQLKLIMRCSSDAEAAELAKKQLRLVNKYSARGDFTFPGDPSLVAGITIRLADFGPFYDGKYIVSKSVHSISESGYTTKISLRKCMEGV